MKDTWQWFFDHHSFFFVVVYIYIVNPGISRSLESSSVAWCMLKRKNNLHDFFLFLKLILPLRRGRFESIEVIKELILTLFKAILTFSFTYIAQFYNPLHPTPLNNNLYALWLKKQSKTLVIIINKVGNTERGYTFSWRSIYQRRFLKDNWKLISRRNW